MNCCADRELALRLSLLLLVQDMTVTGKLKWEMIWKASENVYATHEKHSFDAVDESTQTIDPTTTNLSECMC